MKEIKLDEKIYRLPNGLNPFQQELYTHLINWKWEHITKDPGGSHGNDYDAILPECYPQHENWPHLYPYIQDALKAHRVKNDFRLHKHFYHMASSQAANINLFLPILYHHSADAILRAIKPDFATLATDHLDNGYCLEFWGGNFGANDEDSNPKGLLGDKTMMAGTDADIAIAYRNHQGEICLWLIEHKLTEKEFTECGGFKSKGKKDKHDCRKSFAQIVADKHTCYYHDKCNYNYWTISADHQQLFANSADHVSCPFRGGMNQLWRNQLLALAIEEDKQQPYKQVTFSVVRHPANDHLGESVKAYKALIAENARFTEFTSAEVVSAAEACNDALLNKWIDWYKGLYKV